MTGLLESYVPVVRYHGLRTNKDIYLGGNLYSGSTVEISPSGSADNIIVQTAVDSLAATGGTVILREGTYVFAAKVNIFHDNIRIIGKGGATVVTLVNGANTDGFWVGNGTSAFPQGCSIESLKLDGNRSNQSANGFGVQFLGSSGTMVTNCHVRNVTFVNWRFQSFWGQYCDGCTFNDNYLDQNGTTSEGGAEFEHSTRCIFDSNISKNSGSVGGAGGNGLEFDTGTTYSTMVNNVIYTTIGDGIEIDGSDYNTVADNTIIDAGNHGISILGGSKKNTVTGNVILSPEGCGVKVQTSSPDNIINNNTIEGAGSHGVDFRDSVGGELSNNIIESSTLSGILVQTADYVVCNGNKVQLNQQHGIYWNRSSYGTIQGNVLKNNSQQTNNTYNSIFLDDNGTVFATHNTVIGNVIRASAANKVKWGIREDAVGNDYNNISHNTVTGAVTAAFSTQGANSVVQDNITG